MLHPIWEEILRYLARRVVAGWPPSVRELATAEGLRSSQTTPHQLKKLEDCEHEDLVLPSEDVGVQGFVVHIVHLPNKRADGGGT